MPDTAKAPANSTDTLRATQKTVNILGHVERLGPSYMDGWVYFSFNLSAVLSTDDAHPITEDDIKKYLQPWAWKWTKLSVLGVDDKGMTVEFPGTAVEMVSDAVPVPAKALTDALEEELKKTIELNKKAGLPFTFFLGDFGTPLEPTPRKISESERDWKSFIAHVSTYPAPLPQSLNLSVFFRIEVKSLTDLNVKEVVAAPLLDGDPFGKPRAPKTPHGGAPWDIMDQAKPLHRVVGSEPLFYLWAYDQPDPKDIPILASLNQCITDPVPAGDFFDFSKLWLGKDAVSLWVDGDKGPGIEDWTIRFEMRLAEAFDMPRRLLDALFLNLQGTGPRWAVTQAFHDAFLASLRDLANYGLPTPPDGRPLAEYLIRRRTEVEADVQRVLKKLRDDEALRYATLAPWVQTLKEFVEKPDPNTRFPEFPATPDSAYARALERLYGLLANESSLASLFLSEWDKALRGDPFWSKANFDASAADLSGLQLRKRLALGNSGIAWRSLTGVLHKKDELTAAVKAAFKDYFDHRFGNPGVTGYESYLPPAPGLPAEIGTGLDKFAEVVVSTLVLPTEPTAENPGTMNEDLVFQVNELKRKPKVGSKDDQQDAPRRLAGLGVLLRVVGGTGEWRFLNLAKLEVRGNDLGLTPVPVPLRLSYRNGLSQSFLAYRNQPMAARSPAAEFSSNRSMVPPKQDDQPELLGYGNPYGGGGAPRLETLVYGKDYEGSVFLFGNAGNLPKELVAALGGKPVPWKWQAPASAPPFTQTIPYRRRVPVGLVRLGSPSPRQPGLAEETERLAVLPIPENVFPLARSIHPVNATTQHQDREDAVVLLTPQGSPWLTEPDRTKFEFSIRPPSVPLEVWDRWVANDPTAKDKRIRVWAKFHEYSDLKDSQSKADKRDLSIDDPAVEQLRFTLTQVYPAPFGPVSFDCPIRAVTGDCTADLSCVQSSRRPVTVRSGTAFHVPSGPIQEGDSIDITIPVGQVWKLDIAPVIGAKGLDWFDKRIKQPVGNPVTVFVEVASPFPDDLTTIRKDMNSALSLKFVDNQLEVWFQPKADWPIRDTVHRVEVMLQRWRWDGRPVCYIDNNVPVYQFPFDAVDPASLDLPESFDGTLFASRESSDLLAVPAWVDFAAPASPAKPKPMYQLDLSTTPGALYYRGALQVYSRYEGLLLSKASVDSRTPPADQAEKWKRMVIPGRWNKPVPTPVVKLIVPLTRAASDVTGAATTPGLLVILDEAWHLDSMGGVGDQFEYEVIAVSLPDLSDEKRYQLSPDPILDMPDDPLAGRNVTFPPATGAIGYTTDTGTLAPLYTRASFIVPPPQIEGISNLSWYLIKLRFRRRLQKASLKNIEENKRPLMAPASDWTHAEWAQFLSPSNLIAVQGADALVDTQNLVLDTASGFFRTRGGGKKVVPLPTPTAPSGRCHFALYILLTRSIIDALGRNDQEAYFRIVFLKADGMLADVTPTDLAGTRARFVEIQAVEDVNGLNPDELFKKLFPSDGTKRDAAARIVRVSPPIGF